MTACLNNSNAGFGLKLHYTNPCAILHQKHTKFSLERIPSYVQKRERKIATAKKSSAIQIKSSRQGWLTAFHTIYAKPTTRLYGSYSQEYVSPNCREFCPLPK